MADISRICPHCDSRLKKWRVPDGASWDEKFFYACFNDECPYYIKGWKWMEEHFSQKASYRYALNPTTGQGLPLPVWSDIATREMIVEDDEGEDE